MDAVSTNLKIVPTSKESTITSVSTSYNDTVYTNSTAGSFTISDFVLNTESATSTVTVTVKSVSGISVDYTLRILKI